MLLLAPADASTTWIAVGSVGTFCAAGATVVLAFVTKALAGKTNEVAEDTKRLAIATEQSASAARAAVEAVEEPFVIAVPTPPELIYFQGPTPGPSFHHDIHRADSTTRGRVLHLRLWNIGMGPAIVESVRMSRPEQGECLGELPGGFRPIGAGQAADMDIPVLGWPPVLGDGSLTIIYTHANGRSYETRSEVSIGEPGVIVRTYARARA